MVYPASRMIAAPRRSPGHVAHRGRNFESNTCRCARAAGRLMGQVGGRARLDDAGEPEIVAADREHHQLDLDRTRDVQQPVALRRLALERLAALARPEDVRRRRSRAGEVDLGVDGDGGALDLGDVGAVAAVGGGRRRRPWPDRTSRSRACSRTPRGRCRRGRRGWCCCPANGRPRRRCTSRRARRSRCSTEWGRRARSRERRPARRHRRHDREGAPPRHGRILMGFRRRPPCGRGAAAAPAGSSSTPTASKRSSGRHGVASP